MTFLHKLAKRLARLKVRTLIAATAVSAAAAIVGCEQPVSGPITPTVSRLVASPKTVPLAPDQTQDFMAVGFTPTGDTAQVDVTWSTTGGSVGARETHGGRHTGWFKNGLCGNYTVTATTHPGNVSDAASATVTCPGTVTSVSVTPPAPSVAPGQTVQLTANALDASGNVLTGWTMSWSSSNPGIATVNSSGLVTGVATGSATITATSGGQSGSAAVTVTGQPPVPAASVTVRPTAASLQVGQTTQPTATPQDANGN